MATKMTNKDLFFLSVKMYALIFGFMPFWMFPLLILFVLKMVEIEQHQLSFIQHASILLPVGYAYITILVNFVKIQRDRILNKKWQLEPLKSILKNQLKQTFILLFLQVIYLLLNQFSGEALVIAFLYQIFYFVVQVQEFFYQKIIDQTPKNHQFLSFGKIFLQKK